MSRTDLQKLREVLEFTRIYQENSGDIYLREARCLDYQLEHILVPLDEESGIAGRYDHGFVGFSSQTGGYSVLGAGYTYYFKEFEFVNALQRCTGELTASENYAESWTWPLPAGMVMSRVRAILPRAWGIATAGWRGPTLTSTSLWTLVLTALKRRLNRR